MKRFTIYRSSLCDTNFFFYFFETKDPIKIRLIKKKRGGKKKEERLRQRMEKKFI